MSKLIPEIKKEFFGKPVNWLGGNKWLHVYEFLENGYTFAHEPKWDDKGVAILPFRVNPNAIGNMEFLVTNEKRPVHGGSYHQYAITGGYDDVSLTTAQTALKELKEETGYDGALQDLIYLGKINNSKMTTGHMYLYAIDVTDREAGERTLDGSVIEQEAFTSWVNAIDLVKNGDNLLSKMHNVLLFMQMGLIQEEQNIALIK